MPGTIAKGTLETGRQVIALVNLMGTGGSHTTSKLIHTLGSRKSIKRDDEDRDEEEVVTLEYLSRDIDLRPG